MTKRRIYVDAIGGLMNPDAHIPCGAVDPNARQLELVHIGGCTTCMEKVKEIYKERHPKKKSKPAEPIPFSFMVEDSESDKRMVRNETGVRKRRK